MDTHLDRQIAEAAEMLAGARGVAALTGAGVSAESGMPTFRGADGIWDERVVARVATEGFHLLDAPPQRLNARDTPVPAHPSLWEAHRPTLESIAAALRNLLRL